VDDIGYVDLCQQSHVAGWARIDNAPSRVKVLRNGAFVGEYEPNVFRPDLGDQCGFNIGFDEPLRMGESVEVRVPDGRPLAGSPCNADQRLHDLLDGIDIAGQQGLEIGPLDRPILSKRHARVLYVDHATREHLVEKYVHTGSPETFNPDRVVETDVVWDAAGLRSRLAPNSLDYCLASHVMEHVADPLTWLRDICGVLRPGGLINLAIPDQRLGFDFRRPVTRPSALVDAFIRKLTRPSAGQVFDHVAHTVQLGSTEPLVRPDAIQAAYRFAEMVSEQEFYMDVHCHVFTDASFLDVFEVLAYTGLIDFRLRAIFPARPRTNEFIVSLEAGDFSMDDKGASFARARSSRANGGAA
jgi:SAM-dependent methyltransferase